MHPNESLQHLFIIILTTFYWGHAVGLKIGIRATYLEHFFTEALITSVHTIMNSITEPIEGDAAGTVLAVEERGVLTATFVSQTD